MGGSLSPQENKPPRAHRGQAAHPRLGLLAQSSRLFQKVVGESDTR